MFQKDEYCILILGLDNAGKTTFLEQSKTRFNKNYKGMSLSKITTTVGLNIGTVDVGKARLMFWDLGGQEELQSLWDKYYAECHGVIYVIDSTDEERLCESKCAFEKMVTSEALDGVPILVLAGLYPEAQGGGPRWAHGGNLLGSGVARVVGYGSQGCSQLCARGGVCWGHGCPQPLPLEGGWGLLSARGGPGPQPCQEQSAYEGRCLLCGVTT
uniref:ARF related protein 1 n=1 Tax=Sus scrofa TaxID=9823 RepID=A0A8D1NPJ4_PIG